MALRLGICREQVRELLVECPQSSVMGHPFYWPAWPLQSPRLPLASDYIWGAKTFYKFSNSPACLFMPLFFPSVLLTQSAVSGIQAGKLLCFQRQQLAPLQFRAQKSLPSGEGTGKAFLSAILILRFCCQELLSLWSPLQLWELWISSLLHLVTRLSKDYE